MKKILLVDTNFSAVPIYDSLRKNGYEVYVCGGNPTDFLARTVQNYINLDYSSIDDVRAFIDKIGIDYIVPGCNDRSYQICAELNSDNRFWGLDNPFVTETLNNKKKFRGLGLELGLPIPRAISNEKIGEVWPIIIKPVDAYSGRGITVVNEPEQGLLQKAIQRARQYSRAQDFLIEEYVDGQLYSHSAFLQDGKVHIDFIVEEHGSANPFVVDTSRVVDNFSPTTLQKVRETIAYLASILGLVDGLIHTQFILHDGEYWMIEITRRCPGDLYAELIERSTGFKYAEAYASFFLNEKIATGVALSASSHILRHTVSAPDERTFNSIEFQTQLKIEKYLPLCVAGDTVKASPFGRIGLLFVKAEAGEQLSELMKMAIDRSLYVIH
jgi:biotin carboxylase